MQTVCANESGVKEKERARDANRRVGWSAQGLREGAAASGDARANLGGHPAPRPPGDRRHHDRAEKVFVHKISSSERLQKRRAGGRRPPAAQLSLWLQWGHRTKRIDMHRTRTGHHDGNRRRTTTTQPQTSSRAVTRAVTHATYISSMRAVNSTMRLRNTRPTAGTAVLPAGERTPHAPRSSASHR